MINHKRITLINITVYGQLKFPAFERLFQIFINKEYVIRYWIFQAYVVDL